MTKVLGIDIGGTNTKLGVVSANGDVIASHSFPTQADESLDLFFNRLKLEVTTFSKEHSFEAIGVGSPNYSSVTGELVNPPNLSWGNAPLYQKFSQNFSQKCFIENDANVAAIGEKVFGSAVNLSDFVVITVGTGIGSGIFINNKLFRGHNGLAGEAGHITIGSEGRVCGCGGLDHFESYCSVKGIKKTYQNITNVADASYRNLVKLFLAEDDDISKVFNITASHFARALSIISVLFSPKAFILTGGGMSDGDKFTELIRSKYIECSYSAHKDTKIILSSIAREHGAVLGAASVALSSLSK